MNLIAFETATPTGGAALLKDGLLAGEMSITNPQAHSRLCLALAEQLLKQSGMAWKDLDAVATSCGPGSFTGLRVGLSLAKSLAWSLELRTIAVPTLQALAHHCYAGEPVQFVVPLLDARIGELYGAVFRAADGQLTRLREDFVAAPQAVARLLPGPALFAGEGALAHHGELWSDLGPLARPDRVRLTPGATGALALEKLLAGEQQRPEDLAAVYLREAVQPR